MPSAALKASYYLTGSRFSNSLLIGFERLIYFGGDVDAYTFTDLSLGYQWVSPEGTVFIWSGGLGLDHLNSAKATIGFSVGYQF